MRAPGRRTFLRGGAALLGTAAATPAVGGRAPAEGGVAAAIATICCDGFGDEDFRYAFDLIPRLGIENVEFNVWYPRNLTPAGLASIADRCEERGLRPISLQASGLASAEEGGDLTREVSRLMWLVEGCRRLGCRIVKVTGSRRGTRGGLPGVVALMRETATAAAEAGVTLALENHKNNNLELPEDYERIFEAVDSPAVGICYDMGHFSASSVDLHGFVDRFHERIVHVDVKDNVADGEQEFVRFGSGVVPCAELIGHLVEKGYRGYLVIELSLIDRATVLDDLRAGRELVRPYET